MSYESYELAIRAKSQMISAILMTEASRYTISPEEKHEHIWYSQTALEYEGIGKTYHGSWHRMRCQLCGLVDFEDSSE